MNFEILQLTCKDLQYCSLTVMSGKSFFHNRVFILISFAQKRNKNYEKRIISKWKNLIS